MSESSPEDRAKWVENRRQYVLQTAKQAEDGSVNLLLAVHEIHKWLFALPELTRLVAKEDIGYLKKVRHESQELPLSTERQYWAPESLREKDLIAQSLIKRVREDVLSILVRIADDLKRGA